MRQLDIRGLRPPEPVLKVRRILVKMDPGEILEVQNSDPSTVHDLPAFCKSAGYELILAEEKNGALYFRIKCSGITES